MARKLFALTALMTLLSLAPAGAVWGATYYLGKQGGYYEDVKYVSWRHYYPGGTPWAANTEFIAGAPEYDSPLNTAAWKIGFCVTGGSYQPFTNSEPGVHTEAIGEDPPFWRIVFDTTNANPRFFLDGSKFSPDVGLPENFYIQSNDLRITYTAPYKIWNNQYTLYYAIIIGEGHNTDGTFFKFTVQMQEDFGENKNFGYIYTFNLEYPAASPVPLPAGVWLLGTGLLGLACLGWRRKG